MTDRTHFWTLYLYIHLLILCHNKVIYCLFHFFSDEIWVSFFICYLWKLTIILLKWTLYWHSIAKWFCISWDMHRCNCTHDTWPTIMFHANNVCFCCRFYYRSFFIFFLFARKFTMVTWHVSRGHMTWVVFQWKLTIYPSHYICINRVIYWIKEFFTCSPSSVQFLLVRSLHCSLLKKGGGY